VDDEALMAHSLVSLTLSKKALIHEETLQYLNLVHIRQQEF